MAATTGLPKVSSRRRSALMPSIISKIAWASSGVAASMPLRLPPAKKVFFAEVMTTPETSSFSAYSLSTALPMDSL